MFENCMLITFLLNFLENAHVWYQHYIELDIDEMFLKNYLIFDTNSFKENLLKKFR